jgi:hypothetical protein
MPGDLALPKSTSANKISVRGTTGLSGPLASIALSRWVWNREAHNLFQEIFELPLMVAGLPKVLGYGARSVGWSRAGMKAVAVNTETRRPTTERVAELVRRKRCPGIVTLALRTGGTNSAPLGSL